VSFSTATDVYTHDPRNAVRDVNDQRFFRALCPTQIQAMIMGERSFRVLAHKGENQLS
jgi:hypothetical protein